MNWAENVQPQKMISTTFFQYLFHNSLGFGPETARLGRFILIFRDAAASFDEIAPVFAKMCFCDYFFPRRGVYPHRGGGIKIGVF